MAMFFLGFASAIAVYFVVGFGIGATVVIQNLARFHGGGFQWGRMLKHSGMIAIVWPAIFFE